VSFAYLGALLFSLLGLSLIDYKFKLAFFGNSKRAAITLAVPYLFFVSWDLAGIAAGIFFRGDATHILGVMVFPEFPLEEAFFLGVLCYTGLLLTSAMAKVK
jgi:lycopene cyclase domain-containing protein